jgi:hypothetical protein
MPLMRDITCVTSSNSSRDRQRSTAAAGSSPMLSSTMAACSTGVSWLAWRIRRHHHPCY